MKKRIAALCLAFIFVFSLASFSVSAKSSELLIDGAQLLSPQEAETLSEQLEEISERQDFVVAIITIESLPDGVTSEEEANYLYDEYYGKKQDGCLLLRVVYPKEVYVLANGFGDEVIDTDDMIDKIADEIISGNYYKAFTKFAKLCDKHVVEARKFPLAKNFLICLGIGFLVALIAVLVMRSQLKSVRPQNLAQEYLKEGSLNITEARDLYLYSHITKTKIEKGSSGGSSGGSSRSGSGRSI